MTEPHPLDIPDFLRRSKDEKRDPIQPGEKPRARRKKEKRQPFHLPRSIEPAGLKLLKEIEAQKKAKAKERFKLLKERYGKG